MVKKTYPSRYSTLSTRSYWLKNISWLQRTWWRFWRNVNCCHR